MQPITRFVFDLSAFLKHRIQAIAISVSICVGILIWAKRLPAVKKKGYELAACDAPHKNLISQAALTRFSFVFLCYSIAACHFPDALRLSKEALKIPAMQLDMEEAEKDIRR